MIDVILDTLIDGIKLLPFLLVTYLILEYLEHKTSDKSKEIIKKSGKWGPLIGGALGVLPQCGFSAAAASLYSGRVITLGTLIAIFLSTSDEMLPILISEAAPIDVILKVLLLKFVIGIIFGFIIDFAVRILKKIKDSKNDVKENKINSDSVEIKELCEHEHCHCEEDGIVKSAIKHSVNIFIFIVLITLLFNVLIYFIGEEQISSWIVNKPILGPMIAALIGLIPNCASSVILTKLYLTGVINISTMISGLLAGSGTGILILCRTNKNWKENLSIIVLVYVIGVVSGILLECIGIESIMHIV